MTLLPAHDGPTWSDSGGHIGCRIDGDLVRGAIIEACPSYLSDEAAEDIANRTLAELDGMAGVTVLRGSSSTPWVPSHTEREPMPDTEDNAVPVPRHLLTTWGENVAILAANAIKSPNAADAAHALAGQVTQWARRPVEDAAPVTPDKDTRLDGDVLYEKLAAIEHARWSGWQRYVHNLCDRHEDGSLTIPAHIVAHWERQMNTQYAELSAREKQSDREQVNRYWPLIRP